ncbi:hypothetical protein [Xanthomonas vesicatoria]|uniref:Uncharacterized protein n=1 Tax=Xanthomonas vesicatoria ATCC 35937 TaxID=925775 RepID=F0B7T0_9XANT|nr:hypothetical protein [Xanthomonas vesicatoria]APP75458.1 hypothetical protein BJD12_09560 [Xanthomonas vesicatoria ATCC 35937]EGD11616.1 hypothetical protein XVE_0124 [Xanthomonas vesicatoria ATCC 35937]KTF32242.1 hypothetical protein LMG920_13695 [Xanthomonas vesicatoria]MCC8599070.1 hypothetical protein [Xanthomonas vesicatoria]MCC8603940.1 hypothetical protein [Xanthomonas vesicatoria]
MHAVSVHRHADVQSALTYWRDQHRRGQLGYHPFDGIPEGTVRAVCDAYNAQPDLSEQQAIKAVRDALCLTPGSSNAALADWLAPRCLRHLRSA